MSFTIELTKDNSITQPENLDKLVSWVRVELTPYNSLCEYIAKIHVDKPKAYKTLEELSALETAHALSLRNSERRIYGENVLMCATLRFVYGSARRGLDEDLAEISRVVAKGNFKLCDSGYTLLAGYTGKCSSHTYSSLEKKSKLDLTCTDKWDNKYLTYRQIFNELRTLTEEAACISVG